jgi:hypothetical protein
MNRHPDGAAVGCSRAGTAADYHPFQAAGDVNGQP